MTVVIYQQLSMATLFQAACGQVAGELWVEDPRSTVRCFFIDSIDSLFVPAPPKFYSINHECIIALFRVDQTMFYLCVISFIAQQLDSTSTTTITGTTSGALHLQVALPPLPPMLLRLRCLLRLLLTPGLPQN